MDIYEFELRYRAYEGMKQVFDLDWDESVLVSLVKIKPGKELSGKIQDITPEELRDITVSTYSDYKQEFLDSCGSDPIGASTMREYIERLEYEMKVIKEMGFNTYFLIVQDFIVWSKKNEIMVGPGRGSGAGSLLAWYLRITDVDPLEYGLLFERFLNPARVSMPDFDIDFEDTLRDAVIRYVTDLYGHNKVCAIGTYMKLASKAAFKDAARALGLPFDKSNMISNMITDANFSEMLANKNDYPEFINQYESDEIIKRAVDLGIVLEGNLRQLGVHACGIIIAPEPVTTYTAVEPISRLQTEDQEAMVVSQFDGKATETLGLLKMDFLGLRNLSVIKNCIKILRAKYKAEGKDMPVLFKEYFETMSFQPPLDDEYTYKEVFQKGNTTGIFQFEGGGMRRFLVQLKANDINDLVAMSALYRPGPMEFIPRYIARKHGEEEVSYMSDELKQLLVEKYDDSVAEDENKKLVEDLDPIMNLTYGIAVYQEQLMFLVQAMAGFSLAEADLLRRGVGKKIREVIEKLKKEFIEKSGNYRGYKPETAQYIYEKMIEPAASYSFNKSHSVCYSLIAYQTGYLKAHYPVEFYASLLRSKEEDSDKLSFFIDEVKEQGIEVALPDVNESYNHVAAVGEVVRLGFLSVKGIGYEVGEFIESERKANGNFSSLEDFLERCDSVINKKSLEGLIKSGGLDRFGDRKTFFMNISSLLEWGKVSQQASGGLFGGLDIAQSIRFEKEYQITLMEKIMMEFEVFKTFVSVHPFDGLYPYLKKYTFISQFAEKENYGPFTMVGFIKSIQRARKKGFFMKIEDVSGSVEFFVKDKLEFSPFDIVMVQGYKGRGLSIEKIIVLDLDDLKNKAQNARKYNESMTVAAVKSARKKEAPDVASAVNELSDTIDSDDESIDSSLETVEVDDDMGGSVLKFLLPDELEKIHSLAGIVKDFAGEKLVFVGDKEYFVNEAGIIKLQEILEEKKD